MIAGAWIIWVAATSVFDWARGYLPGHDLLDYFVGTRDASILALLRGGGVGAPVSSTTKMEDAVATLSVPWKWDILHRWKHGERLRNRRHPATAALLQDKTAAEEQPFDDRMLLVYDRDLCTKEEDDPSDAIVFFHPADMALEQKCELCCQLVGLVHFFNSCFDTPQAVELRNSRVAVRVLDNYIVVLGAPKSLASYVLQQQMDLFARLLRFYHKGLADMKKVCSSGEPFGERVREFCNSCLPVCCGARDQLSNLFRAVPTLELPEAASNVFTKGYKHLEELQKMPGVLASCVIFDERVLASQFTPEITQLLLLAATSKERLAMQDVPVKYPIPPAVRLVNVYLEASWLKDLAVINKQSNESPKELDKYVVDDDANAADDEKSLSRSDNLIQEQDTHDDGTHQLPAPEDKEPERADSLSDVDSAMSSQTTNQSSPCAPLASTILQATGKQSLPDSDFLSDFDSAEDTSDGAGPDACLRRLADLQYTVADCLRISRENLATDSTRRRRSSYRNSKRNLRKYVSRPDLNRVLKDIEEVQGQEYTAAATPYRYDTDANVFQDYDAGMGFDAAGLFYQAQTMVPPTLTSHPMSQRTKDHAVTSDEVTTCQPHNQILFGLYAKKFQRALTKFGEACSSLSRSKEGSSGKRSLLAALRKTYVRPPESEAANPEQDSPKENIRNTFDLPPVVQVELGEALDVPIEDSNKSFRKHKDNGGGLLRLYSMRATEQPQNGSERVCSAEDIRRCTVLSDNDIRTDTQCELRRTTLFVQRYCNMACLVLLADAAEEKEDFIYSLWRRCIAELGDLEVAARSWQQRDTQPGNATACAEVCYNSKLSSVRGSLPALVDNMQWYFRSIQCAHGEFLRSSCINNINAL
ncbi:hypothetical protein HPB49_020937 [Dermacentor silvarum]|uniref:Uncharacterized protein n=2 Tax=Dermacentor silvarum TaxID=543639 RepID=A0ACB8D863_DERSI|nr:hypothetical protein HPB49_020937 [Dermacentor silvarum]